MKANFKNLCVVSSLIVMIAVVVVFSITATKPNDNLELGALTLGEMQKIHGGGIEGTGCYRKINPDCGGEGGKPDHSCPSFAESCGNRVLYSAIYESRNKKLLESNNNLAGTILHNQTCYISKACKATAMPNHVYNGTTCVPSTGLVCYQCEQPQMDNPTINQKQDYRCDDP
jgi:hypothetical protein